MISTKDIPELLAMIDDALWRRLEGMSPKDVKVAVYRYLHAEWPSPLGTFCPTCGSLSCPNVKNAAAMCPGPSP